MSDIAHFLQIKHEYTLHNQTLGKFQLAKYKILHLGITIYSDNLNWGQHVSDTHISSTAIKTFSFLYQNLFLTLTETMGSVCKMHVCPKQKHAVWNQYTQVLTGQTEKVQELLPGGLAGN